MRRTGGITGDVQEWLCFLNDPASTKSYTCGHALSLADGLTSLARDGGYGQLYVGGDDLDLAAWEPVLAVAGVEMRAAKGQLSIWARSEEHTSELQSLMRISYAVF